MLQLFASAPMATRVITDYLAPILQAASLIGGIAAVAMLVIGGFNYATASGDPEKLQRAKTILKRAVIGLLVILAASTLVGMLDSAYSSTPTAPQKIEAPVPQAEIEENIPAVAKLIIDGITGFVRVIVTSLGKPILQALSFFVGSTPLVASSEPVFNMWLVILAIANALFVLLVVIIGFHIMSSSVFGFEDMDLRQLLPRLGLTFVLMNSSIFLVDMLISLSNTLIKALNTGFNTLPLWTTLETMFFESSLTGVAVMLIMVAFVIISMILLVYYLGRIVTIYLGAILSPLVILVGILPSFRDFSMMLARSYFVTIFVLFIHNVIIKLASAVLLSAYQTNDGDVLPLLLPLGIAIAALIAMLKVEGVMTQFASASVAPRAMRNMSRQLVRSSRNFIGGAKAVGTSKPVQAAAKKGAAAAGQSMIATKNAASKGLDHAKKGAATVGTAAMIGMASPMVHASRTSPSLTNNAITKELKINRNPYKLAKIEKGNKDG